LQRYAQEIGIDVKRLKADSKELPAIIVDTAPYQMEDGKYTKIKPIQAKTGESLDLYPGDLADERFEKKDRMDSLRIAALTDQLPLGVEPGGIVEIQVIVSQHTFEKLAGKGKPEEVGNTLFLKSKDPVSTEEKIDDVKEVMLALYNDYQERRQGEQIILFLSVFMYGFITLIATISVANIFNTISTSIALRKREFGMLKSVGMTPIGFRKMIHYESLFYGIKALLYGLPVSIVVMYGIHRVFLNSFTYPFALPWLDILYVMIGIFVIVGSSMLYSSAKVKKESIIDALKQENL